MPLIRKVIDVGDSKGITLPKSWLEYWEHEIDMEITEVAVETQGKSIIISLILPKKKTE